MTQLAYKCKYGGLGKIILTGLVSTIFIFILFIVSSEITPASISVSGYTRRDGTSVHSYSRRPPGSVDHDAPYQTMQLIFGVAGVASGVYCIVKIRKFKKFNIDEHYLANFKFEYQYPVLSIKKKAIPTKMVTPRKSWNCDICNKLIYSGTVYYCYSKEQKYNHTHICSDCREEIEKVNRLYNREKKLFDVKYAQVRLLRIEEFANQYHKEFDKNVNENIISAI